jgi:hypothetical protein
VGGGERSGKGEERGVVKGEAERGVGRGRRIEEWEKGGEERGVGKGGDPGAADTRTVPPGRAVGIGLGAAAKKGEVHVALRTGTGGKMW